MPYPGSKLRVQLSKSLSDDWDIVRAVFEEELKAICLMNAAKFERIKASIQDEFAAHLLDVHSKWCESCPTPSRSRRARPNEHSAPAGFCATFGQDNRGKIYASTSTQTNSVSGDLQIGADDYEDDMLHSDICINPPSSSMSHPDEDINYDDKHDTGKRADDPSPTIDANTEFIKVEVVEDSQDAGQWHGDNPIKEEGDTRDFLNVAMDTNNLESPQRYLQEDTLAGRSGLELHSVPVNQVSDTQLNQERDPQDSNDVGIEASVHVDELPSRQEGGIQTDASDGKATSEKNKESPSTSGQQGLTVRHTNERDEGVEDDISNRISKDGRIAVVNNNQCPGSSEQEEKTVNTNENNTEHKDDTSGMGTSNEILNTPAFTLQYGTYGAHTFPYLACSRVPFVEEYFSEHVSFCKEDESFTCLLCNKNFLRKGDVKRHMMIHTGQKIFQCSLCPKSFAQKRYLKRHMRQIHNGHFPYHYSISF